jgi:hypothetical protein
VGEQGFDAVTLRKYRDVARIEHVHTAGNSSGIVDGAALALIGNAQAAETFGRAPRARIVATALVGTEPTIMLTGPAPAARAALAKAGLSPSDIDLYEVNEAFAAVVLRFQRELGVPDERLNVNGGAIAMGHPLGATGAMLVGTALDELERRANAGRSSPCASVAAWALQRSSSAPERWATRPRSRTDSGSGARIERRDGRVHALSHPREELILRLRAADVVALDLVAAPLPEPRHGFGGFHALRDGAQRQVVGKVYRRSDDRHVGFVLRDVDDERAIDLELVQRQRLSCASDGGRCRSRRWNVTPSCAAFEHGDRVTYVAMTAPSVISPRRDGARRRRRCGLIRDVGQLGIAQVKLGGIHRDAESSPAASHTTRSPWRARASCATPA